MADSLFPSRRRPRAIFVSDVHLGFKHARAEQFLEFLTHCRPDLFYIVGDFIDGWALRRRWRWPGTCNQILQHLLELSRDGTRVFYAPGNHDEFLRSFFYHFDTITIADYFLHETADGRRFLVAHGDRWDCIESNAKWLSWIGSIAYDWLTAADCLLNRVRRRCGRDDLPLSSLVKQRVKKAMQFVSDFEERLAGEASARDCQGVICGHIHMPALARRGALLYANTGDWVENATALVEYHDGGWELLRWVGAGRAETLIAEPPVSRRYANAASMRFTRAPLPSSVNVGSEAASIARLHPAMGAGSRSDGHASH
jgi:UDP-2,3-diacylglucosamine pyrophosphatase LpxH